MSTPTFSHGWTWARPEKKLGLAFFEIFWTINKFFFKIMTLHPYSGKPKMDCKLDKKKKATRLQIFFWSDLDVIWSGSKQENDAVSPIYSANWKSKESSGHNRLISAISTIFKEVPRRTVICMPQRLLALKSQSGLLKENYFNKTLIF